MTARTAADLILARQVAANYLTMAAEVEKVATDRALRKMPLTVRVLRQWAAVARNAARAEQVDPERLP